MKILILDSTHIFLEEKLREAGHEITRDYTSDKTAILEKINQFEGLILRSRFSIDANFLNQASHLKFIGRFGAGLENIDVAVAEKHGILCIRVPEGNAQAVAEHALGMLLALFNRLIIADAEVRQGIWLRKENTGEELSGKTVGIIGYGYMGSAFARVLQGFGVKILIYDKYKTNFAPPFATEVSLAKLQAEADVLSLHIPITAETNYFVDEAFISQFSKPIYLINTARGELVKTKALLAALRSGKVLGACLDVLEFEQKSFETNFANQTMPPALAALVAEKNVLLSPHIAGWSKQSFEKMALAMAEKIAAIS